MNLFTFGEICIGDLFNTLSGRYVKTGKDRAICVLGSVHRIGAVLIFSPDAPIVCLWSCLVSVK